MAIAEFRIFKKVAFYTCENWFSQKNNFGSFNWMNFKINQYSDWILTKKPTKSAVLPILNLIAPT